MRIFLAATAAVILGTAFQTSASTVPAASFSVGANLSIRMVSALRNGQPVGDKFYNPNFSYPGDPGFSDWASLHDGYLETGYVGSFVSPGPMAGSDPSANGTRIYLTGGEELKREYWYRLECEYFYHSPYPSGPADCAGDSVTVTFDYILDISASAEVPDLWAPHEAYASITASLGIRVSDLNCCADPNSERPESGPGFGLSGRADASTSPTRSLVDERTLYQGQIVVIVGAGQKVTTSTLFNYNGYANLAAPPPSPVPLPASALLLGGALAGLVGLRRLRRET
jgi:hypothetical protein